MCYAFRMLVAQARASGRRVRENQKDNNNCYNAISPDIVCSFVKLSWVQIRRPTVHITCRMQWHVAANGGEACRAVLKIPSRAA
jgi:hypothetical protein